MSVSLALDTSVAVPLLVQTHAAHAAVVRWWAGREVARPKCRSVLLAIGHRGVVLR